MLACVNRKIGEVRRYPALAWQSADAWPLCVLGLLHSRVIPQSMARRATAGGSGIIYPRLAESGGEPIRVDLGDPGQIDTFNELFLAHVYDLSRVPFEPDLVVDCGAYCGHFSAMAAGVFRNASIVAFEPNPEHFAMLEDQFARLRRPPRLVRLAVSDRDEQAELSGSGAGGSIVARRPGATRTVSCIDFPAWLRSQASSRLVWKVDVEGAEKLLLAPCLALLPRQCVVFLETHYPDRDCGDMLAPYRSAGFAVAEVRRRPAFDGDYCYVEWTLVRHA